MGATLLTGGMEALIAGNGQDRALPTELFLDHLTELYVAAVRL